MKDWQVRITETIDFIKTATVPNHANKRLAVARLLTERNNAGNISQQLSQQMCQGTLWTVIGRGAEQTKRGYRRALILVRVILLGQNAANTVNTVNALLDTALAGNLDNDLNLVWQQQQAPLQLALNTLRNNPQGFLANNKIHMMAATASQLFNNYIFRFNTQRNRYEFLPPTQLGLLPEDFYLPATVFHLHVQSYQAVSANLGAITGYNVTGADFMVTTQLSGCSVMYQINGNNFVGTHIQPVGITAENLCTALRNNGAFAAGLNNVAVQVFGAQNASLTPNDYVNTPHTYCIGVRSGGVWQLHAQKHNAMDANSVVTTWRIA